MKSERDRFADLLTGQIQAGISSQKILHNSVYAEYRVTDAAGKTWLVRALHDHLIPDSLLSSAFIRENRRLTSLSGDLHLKGMQLFEDRHTLIAPDPGGSRLADCGISTLPELIDLLKELLAGIEEYHRQGIMAPGIDPWNIWIAPDGHAYLRDPVLGRLQDLLAMSSTSMHQYSTWWIAPEMLMGQEDDPRSDLFNIGRLIQWTAGSDQARTHGRAGDAVSDQAPFLLPDWLIRLGNLLCGSLDLRPCTARACRELLIKEQGELRPHQIPCLHCMRPMDAAMKICPSCGSSIMTFQKAEPGSGESLVLTSIKEDDDTLQGFILRLRGLSGEPDFSPEFLTGDLRLYSREEQKSKLKPPVLLFRDLQSEDCSRIIRILEFTHKSNIHLVRYGDSRLPRKFKNAPALLDFRSSDNSAPESAQETATTPASTPDQARMHGQDAWLSRTHARAGDEVSDQGRDRRSRPSQDAHGEYSLARRFADIMMSNAHSSGITHWQSIHGAVVEMERELKERGAARGNSSLSAIYQQMRSLELRLDGEEDPARLKDLISHKIHVEESYTRLSENRNIIISLNCLLLEIREQLDSSSRHPDRGSRAALLQLLDACRAVLEKGGRLQGI